MLTTVINTGPPSKRDLSTGTEPAPAAPAGEPSFSAALDHSRSTRTLPNPPSRSESAARKLADPGATPGTTAAPVASAAKQPSDPRSGAVLQPGGKIAEPRLSVPRLAEFPTNDRATNEVEPEQDDAAVDAPATEIELNPARHDWMTTLKLPTEIVQTPGLSGTLPADTPTLGDTSAASDRDDNKHQTAEGTSRVSPQLNTFVPESSSASIATAGSAPTNFRLEPIASREIATIGLSPAAATAVLSDEGEQLAPAELNTPLPALAHFNGTQAGVAAKFAVDSGRTVTDEHMASATALPSPAGSDSETTAQTPRWPEFTDLLPQTSSGNRASTVDAQSRVTTQHSVGKAIALADPTQNLDPSNITPDDLGPKVDISPASRESSFKPITARDLAPGLHAAAPNPVLHDFESGAVAHLKLPVAVTSPEFPRALGVQVSVLARNGVHQADLQLHPAELGPINVRIEMSGAQTSISFTADLAGTRQVIEAGLPELASALREQGLTLSGGGVFQQPPRHTEQGAQKTDETVNSLADRTAEPDAESTLPRVVVTARQGGVDLYA